MLKDIIMKVTANNVILFVEPTSTDDPINDEYSVKIKKALDNPVEENIIVSNTGKIIKGITSMGVHTCICGAKSESSDYGIYINGKTYYTNSLAHHYVMYHRSSVSQRDLDLVAKLE